MLENGLDDRWGGKKALLEGDLIILSILITSKMITNTGRVTTGEELK
jgi:hypothetical protein